MMLRLLPSDEGKDKEPPGEASMSSHGRSAAAESRGPQQLWRRERPCLTPSPPLEFYPLNGDGSETSEVARSLIDRLLAEMGFHPGSSSGGRPRRICNTGKGGRPDSPADQITPE